MEAVSQVVLRNRERIGPGPVLLVDCPADGLARALGADRRDVRASNVEHGACTALQAQGVHARFEPVPGATGDEALVILRLPREKARFAMILHALASTLRAGARLWVVGEKRAGIQSAAKGLSAWFGETARIDAARHCNLVEARAPRRGKAFVLDDYADTFRVETAAGAVELCSLPGVFAHGRLDPGTALLIEALARLPVRGDVLDFACGNGVVGLSLPARREPPRLTLLDHSALALEAARRSLALNGRTARLVASDGLEGAAARFDWIVSNPPFHRGVASDLDIAARLFARAGTFLRPNGKIVVVYNRHLPYGKRAGAHFSHVRRLAQSRDYFVIEASNSKP